MYNDNKQLCASSSAYTKDIYYSDIQYGTLESPPPHMQSPLTKRTLSSRRSCHITMPVYPKMGIEFAIQGVVMQGKLECLDGTTVYLVGTSAQINTMKSHVVSTCCCLYQKMKNTM